MQDQAEKRTGPSLPQPREWDLTGHILPLNPAQTCRRGSSAPSTDGETGSGMLTAWQGHWTPGLPRVPGLWFMLSPAGSTDSAPRCGSLCAGGSRLLLNLGLHPRVVAGSLDTGTSRVRHLGHRAAGSPPAEGGRNHRPISRGFSCHVCHHRRTEVPPLKVGSTVPDSKTQACGQRGRVPTLP